MVDSRLRGMVATATRFARRVWQWLIALMASNDEDHSKIGANVPLPAPTLSSCLTTERTVILTWLREQAPSLAELYETALLMMYEQRPSARTRLVSHCMRDIANGLPRAIASSTVKGHLDYAPYVERISASWPPVRPQPSSADTPELPPEMPVSRDAYVAVEALLREHASASGRLEGNLQALFAQGDSLAPALIAPAVREFKRTAKWFMHRAHDRGVVDAQMADEAELQSYFEAFERGLYSLAAEWTKGQDQLDEFLEEANRRTN